MHQHNISSIQSFIHYVLSCIPVDIFMDREPFCEEAPTLCCLWPLKTVITCSCPLQESWGVAPSSSWVSFLSGNEALWSHTFLGFYLILYVLRGFPCSPVGTLNYSKPCMNAGDCSPYSFLVFLALGFSLCCSPSLSTHTHAPYSAEDLREDSSADLWNSLFVQLSPVCCFTRKALAVLTSLNSELCFLL